MWSRLRSWHQDRCRVRGQQPVNSEAWPGTIWDPVCRGARCGRGQQRAAFRRCLDSPPPHLPQPPQLLTPYLLPPNLRSPDFVQ